MMSAAQSQTTLVAKLENLQCHFTWDLEPNKTKLLYLSDKLVDIGTEEGNSWLGHIFNLRGFIQYKLGSTEDAQSFFNKAAEAFSQMRNADDRPWLVVNYGNLAWLHHHLGDQAESEAYLSKVDALMKKYPSPSQDELHAETYAEKAWTLMNFRADRELVADYFQRAIRMQPDMVEWNTSHVIGLASAFKYGDKGLAADILEKVRVAKEQDPENAFLAAYYLQQRAKKGEDVEDEAHELAEKVLRNPVSSHSGIKALLRVYQNYESIDEAIDLAEEALEHHPDERYLKRCAALCYNWKIILFSDSRPKQSTTDRAGSLHEEVISLYPHSSLEKEIDLANIHAKSNHGMAKAEQIFQNLLKRGLEPAEQQVLYNHYAIHLYYNRRDENMSIEYHMKAAAIPHQSFYRWNSIKVLEKIKIRSRNRMCGEIEDFLKNLAAQSQTTLVAKLENLQCHFTWDLEPSKTKLLRLSDKLVDIGTEEGNSWLGHIYNLRGFIQYKLGSTEDAQSFFNKAAESFSQMRNADDGPWLVVNYGNLAWLHHHLGDQAESEAYLSKVDALMKKYPSPSQAELHAETYAEKAWTLMKFRADRELVADYFQRAIRMQPDMVEWNTSHVIALTSAFKYGNTELADDILEKVRVAKEQDSENLYLAADYLEQRAKKGEDVEEEAHELAEKVLRNPVSSYSGIKTILRVYRNYVSFDEAIDLAEEALEHHPDERYLKRCAALCYKWKIFFFSDSFPNKSTTDRAVSLHEEVISLYPDSSFEKKIDLAKIHAKSNHGMAKAAKMYQDLLQKGLEPRDKQVLYNQYAKYLNYDQRDENMSIQYHMNAAAIPYQSCYRGDSINVLERIKNRSRNRMCGEIEEFLTNLAAQSQTTLLAKLAALQCHFTWDMETNKTKLIHLSDKLVDIGTEEGNSWLGQIYNLQGFIQYKLGSTEDAQSFFNKAAEAFSQMRNADDRPWLVVNYGNLAWLHHHLGDQAESEVYLSKVDALMKKYPSPSQGELHAETYAEKAWTLMKFSADRELVADYFQRAIRMQPDMVEWNTSHVIGLARAFNNSDTGLVADILEKLRVAKEQDPENLYLAAYYLEQRGKKGEDVEDEAHELAEKVLRNPVSSYSGMKAILSVYRNYVSIDRAIDLAEEALKHHPDERYLKRCAALCYKWKIIYSSDSCPKKSTTDRAVSLHKEVISLYPHSSLVKKIDLANIHAKSEHGMAKAEQMYQDLLKRGLERRDKQVLYNQYAKYLNYDQRDENKSIEYHMKAAAIPHQSFYRGDSITILGKIKNRSRNRMCGEIEEFLTNLAAQSQTTLLAKLAALQCHFTWDMETNKTKLIHLSDKLVDIGTEEGNSWLGHIYNLRGFIQYKLGSTEDAQSFFNKAAESFSQMRNADDGPWLVVNYGNLAWLHHHLGDQAESEAYLSKVDVLMKKYPSPSQDELHAETYAEKAWTLMKFSADRELVADYFQRAIRMQPDMVEWNTSHVIGLARAFNNSDTGLVADILEKLRVAKEQDPENLYLAAYYLEQRGKKGEDVEDEAHELAEKVLRNPVSSYSGMKAILSVYRNYVSIDRAIDLAEEALKHHPDERYLKRCAALCYKWKIIYSSDSCPKKSTTDRAVSLHKEVISLYPHSSLVKKIDLANIHAKSEHGMAKAEQMYQDLLKRGLERRDKQVLYNQYAKYLNYDQRDENKSIEYHMKAAAIPHQSFYRGDSITILGKIKNRSRNRMCGEIEEFLTNLAAQSQTTLLAKLAALQCHFTWDMETNKTKLIHLSDKLVDIGTEEGNSWLGHIYNLRGFIQYRLGSTEDAQSFFNKAAESFSQMRNADDGPWLVVNYGNLAWLHHHLGDQAESEAYLSKVDVLMKKYPSPSQDELHAETYAEKAWTLMKFSADRELVADYFQRAIRMQPDMVEWNTSHVIGLARAFKNSDTELAADILEKVRVAKEQDPENVYLAAYYLQQRAKKGEDVEDEARELAEKVLRNPVSSYSGIKVILRAYRNYVNIDEAINLAEEALKHHPDERYLKRCAALCYKWKIIFFSNNCPKKSTTDRAVSLHEDVISLYHPSLLKEIDLANMYAKSKPSMAKAEQMYQDLLTRDLEPAEQQVLYNQYAKYVYHDRQDENKSIQYHMKAAAMSQRSFHRWNSIKVLEKIKNRSRNRMCGEIEEFLKNLQEP